MKKDLYWGYMLMLGSNSWSEAKSSPVLLTEEEAWDDCVNFMAESGCNLALIDVEDGLQFESHPEISVKGAWTHDFLKKKLAEMKALGITPIPKLNFSAGHDLWLGEYSHMVSSSKYYEVCKDLIEEVADVFDKPEMFHLGMDEEVYEEQCGQEFRLVRGDNLWWHDFYKNVENVERLNIRPWIWSDYYWSHPDLFLKKMPKSVVQSNWYYYNNNLNDKPIEAARRKVEAFRVLEENGFDQIPTGSNYYFFDNMDVLTKYCVDHLPEDNHVIGYLQTPWVETTNRFKYFHKLSIDELRVAKENFYKNKK